MHITRAAVALPLLLLACSARPSGNPLELTNVRDDSTRERSRTEENSTIDPIAAEDDLSALNGSHAIAASLASIPNVWGGWWSTGSTLAAVIDYMDLSGTREYAHIIDKIYTSNINKHDGNFINEFYDDCAWWGLAWVRAYDLTNDAKYLSTARTIADYMYNEGWDDVCGGGIYWKRGSVGKSAIQNELFIKLAASIHNRTPGDTHYLELAKKNWRWFFGTGMINAQNLINDGLRVNPDGSCSNNGEPTWTYNQGIILGGAGELYAATQDPTYLKLASELAKASMSLLTVDGILKERNDPGCGECKGDERLFKGAYVRNLRDLNVHLEDPNIGRFLRLNAKSAWENARARNDWIGFRWEGPFDSHDADRQSSALDLMNGTISRKFDNYALNGNASSNRSSCAPTELPAQAIDGTAATKWCGLVDEENGVNLDIDLGAVKDIHRIRILHAGAGNEDIRYNTIDFELQSSLSDANDWQTLTVVKNNTSSGTTHNVSAMARFVRLHITTAGADRAARIYEVAVE